MTVAETVSMGRWARLGAWRRFAERDRLIVEACMKRLGVAELADRRLGSLSGGQRQRVLLAQGLAQESDLLILDEPAAGLDAAAQETIADLLADARAEGTTVVHATHDASAAAQADCCLLLEDGRLVAEGAPSAVLSRASVEEPGVFSS